MLAISDSVVLLLAALFTHFVIISNDEHIYQYAFLIQTTLVLFYALSIYINHYSIFDFIAFKAKRLELCLIALFTFSITILFSFLLPAHNKAIIPWIVVWAFLSILFLTINRTLWLLYINYQSRNKAFQSRTALIGYGETFQNSIKQLSNYSALTKLVNVYHLDLHSISYLENKIENIKKLHVINSLLKDGQNGKFDKIIVSVPSHMEKHLAHLIDILKIIPVDIQVISNFQVATLKNNYLEKIGNLNLLHVAKKPISDWGLVLKTVFDYITAAIALVVLLPIMLLIALAIKIESSGPVFFKQRRHGCNHKIIHILKFRTMTVCEDGHQIIQAKKNGDERITCVGHFLRRTSLDELPQLLNVLQGEMSLVGPRPHALAHNSHYTTFIKNYDQRHRVKPGITGWAQVHGLRGGTENPELMETRIKYDLEYIESWSFGLDIKIILMTPIHGFIGKNVY
ncbi:MAG: undecaprenyl-phosphate glucose phosphotransferase [Pseudomonadota bacterium]